MAVAAGGRDGGGSFWSKALQADAGWTKQTFPEFPDAVHGVRQVLGVLIGVAWALFPVKNMVGVAAFLALSYYLGVVYYSKYCQVDEEDFKPSSTLSTEGLSASFGVFMVTWILASTLLGTGVEGIASPLN
mmetsp:Transcript_4222/g.12518  ORF Transcript_4222/g.12518 Transcript_4222/m.12518 type:complete len:131 (-) Transcript_4222:365-757(-)